MNKGRLATFLIVFAAALTFSASVRASASFKYYDYCNEKTINYDGVSPVFFINGTKIQTSKMPAIINSRGISMGSAETVFGAVYGLEYVYDSDAETITFIYNGHTLKMTLNSTGASLDGAETEAPCEAYRIKYKKSGNYTTFVPTRFVTESLGMTYEWNSEESKVSITAPLTFLENDEYTFYTGSQGKVKYKKGKDKKETSIDISETPSIIISDNACLPAKKVFKKISDIDYSFKKSTGEITITCNEITIRMFIGSTKTYVNDVLSSCPVAPSYPYNCYAGEKTVYVPGRYVFETLGFDYEWVADQKTSSITKTDKTGIYAPGYKIIAIYDKNSKKEDLTSSQKKAANKLLSDYGKAEENCSKYRQKLCIPIPEDVFFEDIEVFDDFYNHKISFELEGDYTDFYKKNPIKNTGKAIEQIQILYYEVPQITCVNICTVTDENDSIMDFLYTEYNNGYIFVLDKPHCLHERVIVLDAGHGGSDPGTVNYGHDEKVQNFDIVYKYCKKLFDSDKHDIRVYYSRYDDTLVPLNTRAYLAAKVDADFFVSVHQNANDSKDVHGTSIYYCGKNETVFAVEEQVTGTEITMNSESMANLFLDRLSENLRTDKKYISDENFVVISKNSVPAVLLEIGFMSNADEVERLTRSAFKKKVARTIYNTILEIYYPSPSDETISEDNMAETAEEPVEAVG